jgi:Cu/Ag efflux pump CusA
LEIEVDLAAAQQHGIKPGDVRRSAAALLSGIEVGNLFEDQKVFEVVVWGAPETRQNVTDVQELLIDTPAGGHVRLGDVAAVRLASSPHSIRHEDVWRYVDIGADVRGRDVAAVGGDLERALTGVEFPMEYHAELLGGYVENQTAQQRLLGFALAAVVGIFLLLQAAFGSWRLAGLAFLSLPAALAGGLVVAFFSGGIVSLGVLAGFLAILMLTVRNGVSQISHFQRLERESGEPVGPALALRGARERLVPVLATAVATGLALLPLAVIGPVAGNEITHSLALVVLGGLVTATLVNLLIVPALYPRLAPSPQAEPASARVNLGPAVSPAAD